MFYHALYHLVAHWAAFIATLGLLLTIGLILATSPTIRHRSPCVYLIIIVLSGSWWILWRMWIFVNFLNTKLPTDYLRTIVWGWIPHPYNLVAGALGALAITILDLWILKKAV